MTARNILLVAAKDLRDFSRDYKSIAAIILLPFIGLPGLALLSGVLASQQTVSICYYVADSTPVAHEIAGWIVRNTTSILEGAGYSVGVRELGRGSAAGCDLILVFPEGFSSNLSRLDGTATILVSGSLTSTGQEALQAVYSSVRTVSKAIVVERVSRLSSLAGLRLDPEGLLEPIKVEQSYHNAKGATASTTQVAVAEAARVLAFSLYFVVNPAIVFMSDSLSGERERRTIEMLLVSPLDPYDLLAGKILASTVAGLIGAAADSLGILLFFKLSGLSLTLTSGLALLWLSVSLGLVLFSSSLAAIISERTGSVRSAQNLSFLASVAALIFYFAALFVDYTGLHGTAKILLASIPYSQAALALEYYSIGLTTPALAYTLAVYAFTGILVFIASRVFDPERLLAGS